MFQHCPISPISSFLLQGDRMNKSYGNNMLEHVGTCDANKSLFSIAQLVHTFRT